MPKNPILELDGRRLYYTFIAGSKKILENQIDLNRINVFPVNDGDTGTNLAATIRSVLEHIRPDKSYKSTADRIAEAALVGARGNSGIIFAQFLYGMSVETDNVKTIGLQEFAESIKRSVKYVFEAIANPVDGTMLTIIKDWADYIHSNKDKIKDFGQLLIGSHTVLTKSLEATKLKLAVLAKSNVVDAGAKGFVLFIEGIIDFIKSNNVKSLLHSHTEAIEILRQQEIIPESVKYRYCTEAIIRHSSIDKPSLQKILEDSGDSVVIAGSENIRHVHVHTDTPADLFYRIHEFGTISYQKAEDMVRQSEAAYHRKWKIALVTDSACDLSEELLDYYQIHMLPLNLSFGDNHYLDKITIKPEQFYSLLKNNRTFPQTAQINEKSFINLYSHLASHYDSIIAVHLTDKFSGTYNNSRKAALTIGNEFNKQISVINSNNLSGALGLIVLRIAKSIENGLSHDEIISNAGKWIRDTKIFVSVKTLKYMVRGGRVSHLKGFIAKLLNVNPIVSMDDDGKSLVFGKAYSQQSNIEKVIKHISEISKDRLIWNYTILHAQNESAAGWYSVAMKSLTGKEPVSVVNISPVIGMNAGIGAASVAIMFD
jgi:DegV family protein with EDD domain